VELYLHSLKCLNGVVLNYLTTGTTLSFIYIHITHQGSTRFRGKILRPLHNRTALTKIKL
jgi:hypothetical protein